MTHKIVVFENTQTGKKLYQTEAKTTPDFVYARNWDHVPTEDDLQFFDAAVAHHKVCDKGKSIATVGVDCDECARYL